jgi:hypothetical protein
VGLGVALGREVLSSVAGMGELLGMAELAGILKGVETDASVNRSGAGSNEQSVVVVGRASELMGVSLNLTSPMWTHSTLGDLRYETRTCHTAFDGSPV